MTDPSPKTLPPAKPHPLRMAIEAIRFTRLLILLLSALAAGLLTDWYRGERVFFPRPLPAFTTTPADR
jgi:hypothetical protein